MLVRHGLPMRREASHSESGDGAIEFYRPQQHDVLIYDPAVDELGVHAATKGEVRLYCASLGRYLFADAEHFPSDDKYSLDPLIELGSDALACEDVAGLKEVRLVELRRYWGGTYKDFETRKATDLFAALQARDRTLVRGGRLVSAARSWMPTAPKERATSIFLGAPKRRSRSLEANRPTGPCIRSIRLSKTSS